MSAKLPFQKHWPWCVPDTITKTNYVLHSAHSDISRRLWDKHRSKYSQTPLASLSLTKFRNFREHAYVPLWITLKRKCDPRVALVRYIMISGEFHYWVIESATVKLFRCRQVDYFLYNPNFDPTRTMRRLDPPAEQTIPQENQHHAISRWALSAYHNADHGVNRKRNETTVTRAQRTLRIRLPPRSVQSTRLSTESNTLAQSR